MLEGCLEMGLSALISVVMIRKESLEDYWEVATLTTAILSLIVLIITPCYLKRIQNKYLNQVDEGMDKKESEHYELF